MPLDTGPLIAALGPPILVHEGVTYEGRHLSILEWGGFMERVTALKKNQLGLLEQQRLYRDLADAWFPRPAWRPWRRRPRSVGAILLSLPLTVQLEALASFIRSQRRAMGLTVPAAGSTTMAPPTT